MTSEGPVRIPWRADYAVGWGISGFSGAPAPKPWAFEDSARVQLNQLPERSEVVPGNISFQQGVVSSTDDYKRAVDAAGSLSIKCWGVASGKTSADFLSSLEISSKTVHYVVVSSFETATINVLTQQSFMPVLSTYAAGLLAKIGPSRWSEQFGTHFIAGYVLGGQLIGKASFTSSSDTAAMALKGSLEAKFGAFGKGQTSGGAQRRVSTGECETRIQYHCTGAQMSNQQPGDADGMVAAARDYAQNNRGGKYHAILWPFAALNSYNMAEEQYQGNRLPAYRLGCHLLKSLNMEYARLQRLDHTFSLLRDRSEVEDATRLVTRALRAFDKLETLANLAVVDEDAAEYDASLHDRLFVADTAESMLRIASIVDMTSALASTSLGETEPVSQHRFQIGNHAVDITENGTVMSAECGSCLMGPALQSGQVYYLKFEVQAWSGDELFFGVTTNTDPSGVWLKTDAGWFLEDRKGRNCKLSGLNYTFDPTWSSWQTGDRPLFRVDLLANTVAVKLDRSWQIIREACLQVAPQGAVFFCVTMSDPGRVKVLPVTPQEISSL